PVEVFHGDKGLSVLLVNLVGGADARMVQGGCGLRLPLETTQCLWVLRHFVRQKLQSDETVKLDVLGLVDHTHPATAKLLNDAVVRNRLIDHRRRAETEPTC